MIGRADIEGSKSNVAMNAWLPQASYPCGSIGRAFAVPMRTEHLDQASFCPFAPREVSVLAELALGHLRYSLTDVPPQSNSPPGSVLEPDHAGVVTATSVSATSPLCTLGTKHRAPADGIDRAPLPPNRRLFTLETCCGYGYEPARHLHVHPSPEFSRSAESIRTPPQMRCSSRSEPYLPSIGFHGTRTLRQKRKLFPDLSAASSGHFGLPRRTLALKRGNDY
ncbi:hypothetical protein K1T71_012635 [Dendrolimus kikuchii]|uniref:Uncharacterized protein n=5 Tax=Dendrolimus kikuchii TaxID=765133 RepID=A0ACC1CK64_9NEOP|nr:hypothetical protein K1T71_012622 [Dendrolimus kikuchii]KAJ0171862.1 hypothetical protein K1T71_012625 [Dendrolimus kikuchii]KAJ0171865.1 hypothetical protein K1T71_012628 [Dendrolimus kikuchii]KAJ0171869.1 hypothetical protein K1T71_012632 [Dendrolimus kikuchii]KAJ0171872.1 hypothetical protein K1T71_012635 [Dendrolimus kikuchii]